MKKIFTLCALSIIFSVVLPLAVMAESCPGGKWQDNITSDGRNLGKCVCYVSTETYPNCSSSCTDGRVLSAGECVCPQANQYWNGSSCVTTTHNDATTRNNCSAIVCEASYYCSGSNCQGSTDREEGYYSDSLGRCVCPTGYYSNEAPTVGGAGSSSGGSSGVSSGSTGGSSSTTSNTYTSGNSGGGSITFPTVTSTGILTNPITSGSFADLLNRIIDWILNIALVLAPLVIVYGGFIYMTAAGDTGKVTQGKNIVLYAVIGFIVALLAKSLIGIFTGLVVK